ncbi:MAG: LamG domain-containing protein, partial [Chlamydiia bacterium]|nr:LamG domain-containing protein [Chlamydiia bacterium]
INESYLAGYNNHSLQKIVSNETNLGDNWTVAVTPNDGYGDGNTVVSNTVKILLPPQTPPTDPTVVLSASSGDNLSSDNLSVVISGSSDINGDSFVNITDWRKEGVSIALLNFPFDTNHSTTTSDYTTSPYDISNSSGDVNWVQSGRVGGAYEFNDNDDGYFYSTENRKMAADNLTLMIWAKPKGVGTGNYNGMFFLAGMFRTFLRTDGRITIQIYNSTNNANNKYSTGGTIPYPENYGTWRHIAITLSQGTVTFYTNGQEDGSGTWTGGFYSDEASSLYIGAMQTNQYEFNGTLDEFFIFNRTLSAEQINESYLAGLANHSLQKIVSNETSVGENWSVAVTTNDGYGDGNMVVSNNLFIDIDPEPPTDPTVVLSASS